MSKIALVTGCSSGFGNLLVGSLLKDGWTVIATMRDVRKREALFSAEREAHPGRLHLRELDVIDAGGRRDAAAFVETLGGLDLLVNNAGFGVMGAFEDLSEAQLRSQFEVNFFGAALLTKELLPALRRAKGKVIMVSSILGLEAFPLGGAYCSSKFALEGLSESLSYELSPHGVQVCLVEPGAFRTRLSDNTVWGEKSADASSTYAGQTAGLRRVLKKMMERPGTPPDAVVRKIVSLAGGRRMPRRVSVGRDAAFTVLLGAVLPDRLVFALFSSLYDRLLPKEAKA